MKKLRKYFLIWKKGEFQREKLSCSRVRKQLDKEEMYIGFLLLVMLYFNILCNLIIRGDVGYLQKIYLIIVEYIDLYY